MRKIKILIIVMVCLVLFGIRILITYYEIHDNKIYIESKDSEILSKDIKYLKEDGQTIKADDYIFTLEKYYLDYLCEMKPGTGGATLMPVKKISYKGDKKYIYFDFEVDINEFKNILVIKDYTKKEDRFITKKGSVGEFKLENNTEWKEFTNGQNRIKVCHYGAEINDGQETDIRDFAIYMKDGSKHIIKKGDMQEVTFKYKSKITQFRFSNGIDVDNISYIMWNGNRYDEKKELIKQGTYYTHDKESIIEIKEDGTFEFLRHITTNWIFQGNYTIADGKLILSDPSAGEYEFRIGDNDTLIFEKGNEYTDRIIDVGTEYYLK